MGLMLRRMCMMGASAIPTPPLIKTVSGALIHITDALAKPLKKLVVNLEPVQSGSGDPAPDNVRPITGWTGANVYRSGADTSNPTTIPYTFPTEAGTVYGGTLTINEDGSGEMMVDTLEVTFDGSTNQLNVANVSYIGATTTRGYKIMGEGNQAINPSASTTMCNRAKFGTGSGEQNEQVYFLSNNSSQIDIRVLNSLTGITSEDTTSTAKTKMNAYLAENPITVVYKKKTPATYALTSQQVLTLLQGENNIWSDAQSIEITYVASANSDDLNAADSLNLLLGNAYTRGDVPDEEALQIILGETT